MARYQLALNVPGPEHLEENHSDVKALALPVPLKKLSSVQFTSVAQSCPTLCDPITEDLALIYVIVYSAYVFL